MGRAVWPAALALVVASFAWADDLGRLLNEAAGAAARGDLAAAEAAYQQALDAAATDEERAQVISHLGDMRRGKGDREGALRAYQRCLELEGSGPWLSRCLSQLGALGEQLARSDLARTAYGRLASDFADQPNVAGHAELHLCRLDAAQDLEAVTPRLERLLGEEYPTSVRNQARYLLVEVLVRAGEFERAIEVAGGDAENSGVRADLLMQVAGELEDAGRLDEAAAVCRRVLAEQPAHTGAGRHLYEIAAREGTVERLKRELTEAAEGPDAEAALRRLADIYAWEGETQPALAVFERLVELAPRDPEVLLRAGEAAREGGALGLAARWLEAVLQLNPQHRIAAESLGDVYARRGEMERAIEMFKLASDYRPEEPATARGLGRLLSEYSLHREAVEVYERTRERTGDETLFAYELGRACVGLLDYRRATAEFLTALNDPMRGPGMMVAYELMKLARDEVAGEIVVGALDEWLRRPDLIDEQLLAAARAYLAAQRSERALAALARVGPGAGAEIAELARDTHLEGSPALAAELYQAALGRELAPWHRAGVSLRLAELRLERGDWDEALRLLPQAAEVEDYAAEARLLQAEALLRQARDISAAREAYQAVLDAPVIAPLQAAAAEWGLADCLFAEARWDEAEAAYLALMARPVVSDLVMPPAPPGMSTPPLELLHDLIFEQEPGDRASPAYGAFRVAEIALRRGELERAGERFTAMVHQYRSSPWANDALSRLAFMRQNLDGSGQAESDYLAALNARERGDYEQARSLLKAIAAEASEPLADDALMLLGQVLVEQKRWDDAVAAFDRLGAEMSESLLAPSALLQAAVILRDRLGDPVRARERLNRAVESYPDSVAADEARELLEGLPSAE